MAFSNLPNIYVKEAVEYERLYLLGNTRTNVGNITFVSTSSSTTYDTATSLAAQYANQGEEGMILILQVTLVDYILTASDYNTKALFKNGSGTFALGDTTYVVTDAFITANTLVVASPTQATIGLWSVDSAAGSFTITSTATETSTVTFSWGAIKLDE